MTTAEIRRQISTHSDRIGIETTLSRAEIRELYDRIEERLLDRMDSEDFPEGIDRPSMLVYNPRQARVLSRLRAQFRSAC